MAVLVDAQVTAAACSKRGQFDVNVWLSSTKWTFVSGITAASWMR